MAVRPPEELTGLVPAPGSVQHRTERSVGQGWQRRWYDDRLAFEMAWLLLTAWLGG
jgi:hypothetical protein